MNPDVIKRYASVGAQPAQLPLGNQMAQLMAAWAQSRGIPRPQTEDGMKALQGRFLAELNARIQAARSQIVGAAARRIVQQAPLDSEAVAGDITYSTDPISRMDPPPHLLQTDGNALEIEDPEHEQSDFGDLVRNRQRALTEAGGDELAAAVLLRQGEQQALAAKASPVQINPASAPNAVYGNQLSLSVPSSTVTLDQAIRDAPQVASWQGDPSETMPVTVTVAPVTPTRKLFSITPNVLRPFAIVKFGTGGYLTSVEVDVGTGVQFTVSGSSVLVQVGLEPAINANVDALSITMTGMISFRPTMRTTPVYRTRFVDAGGGVQIVPPFAKRLWYMKDGVTGIGTAVTITLADTYNSSLYQFISPANQQMSDPIPLSDDVICVNVLGNATGKLIFELSL